MLRITQLTHAESPIRLKVEGELVAHDASVLERECLKQLEQRRELIVDLSAVTFIDGCGAAALRRLQGTQLTLTGCSPLILELIGDQDGYTR